MTLSFLLPALALPHLFCLYTSAKPSLCTPYIRRASTRIPAPYPMNRFRPPYTGPISGNADWTLCAPILSAAFIVVIDVYHCR
ncbi:hypothetical protein EJ04DRAFT_516193 [Polyplosphaeria fusca]|uniref:Secreted peptide n=1 Tax=Polyplosphaeria fusca TaxID=682080 RepID=A0A9P4QPF6_9PLEO|nr:hypothetical protein EJ04DRAFT_516193 [Polyplosphaeria fusca]